MPFPVIGAIGSALAGGSTAATAAATAAGVAKVGQAAYGAIAPGGPDGMTGYASARDPFYAPRDEAGQRRGFAEDPLLYGGSGARTAEEVERARSRAEGWDSRGQHYADSRDQDAARAASLAARGEQMYGQQLAEARANGTAGSVSGLRYTAGADAAAQEQAAAMAMGPTAMAQRGGSAAMGALAQGRGQGVAGETAAGRAAFMGGANAMRQGDTGMASADAAWEKARADAFNRQRALQDEQSMFFEKQRYGIGAANMGAVQAVNQANLQEYGRNLAAARKKQGDDEDETANTVGMIGTGLQTYANVTAPTPPRG